MSFKTSFVISGLSLLLKKELLSLKFNTLFVHCVFNVPSSTVIVLKWYGRNISILLIRDLVSWSIWLTFFFQIENPETQT